MKLLSDWRSILRQAWSIRLIVLTGILGGAEVVLPLYEDSMPRGIFAALSVLTSVFALVSRVMVQSKMTAKDE